jgi:hypothetical protein
MRRRDWLAALALGLGLSLLCGCAHGTALPAVASTGSQPVTAPLPAAAPVQATPPPQLVALQQPASPYGLVPTVAPRPSPVAAPAGDVRPAVAAGQGDPGPTLTAPVTQVHAQTEPARDNPAPAVQAVANPPSVKATSDSAFAIQPEPEPNLADPAVVLALRYLLDNHLADAVHVLDSYDQQTENVLLCLLPALAHLSDKGLKQADSERMAIWVDELERILDQLRRHANLVLDNMSFCSGVTGWARYQKLPPDHSFRPGDPVQIYVEVRNFACDVHESAYETRLSSSVRLTRKVEGKEKPQVEWEQGFPDRYKPDRTQAPRHDYFCHYCFSIPPNLPLGDYTLTLRVLDLATTPPRVAERSLPLHLTTRPGM